MNLYTPLNKLKISKITITLLQSQDSSQFPKHVVVDHVPTRKWNSTFPSLPNLPIYLNISSFGQEKQLG
jgi:hypothetical protein